jgi:hypothetical protein
MGALEKRARPSGGEGTGVVDRRQVGNRRRSSARIRNARDQRGLLARAIALALFVATLRLQFGFAVAIDIRHSVEPQDLSDCRSPLLVVPVSGGEENALSRGVLYINQVAVDAFLDAFVWHAKNYVFSA